MLEMTGRSGSRCRGAAGARRWGSTILAHCPDPPLDRTIHGHVPRLRRGCEGSTDEPRMRTVGYVFAREVSLQ
jgi:hypothetical protein